MWRHGGGTEEGAGGGVGRGERMLNRSIGSAVWIAAAIALVVVPFGYAITGEHDDVWIGVGCGLVIGVGVGLRGGALGGPWAGIPIGSIVGISALLISGLSSLGFGVLGPSVLGLAVGLIDGLRGASLPGYRAVCRQSFIVSLLFALGLLPVLALSGVVGLTLVPLMCMPWVALIAGLLSHRREGWRDRHPPRLLVLGAVATFALLLFLTVSEEVRYGRVVVGFIPVLQVAGLLSLVLIAVPAATFLVGRVAITWLRPRLQVYGHLTDYLRVMWVPIGGFAIGYLTIIVVFAGFYGMLERFNPGAFADTGDATGIADWLSFAFFNALAQDYVALAPVSVGARVLVGAHLILSVGWALVLFAAVMTSIGPKLDRIARRGGEEGDA